MRARKWRPVEMHGGAKQGSPILAQAYPVRGLLAKMLPGAVLFGFEPAQQVTQFEWCGSAIDECVTANFFRGEIL